MMDEAHIVYASDDKFALVLGVSLVSLFESSEDMKEINVYILDSGINVNNKRKIEEVCEKYKRKPPVWIKAHDINEEIGGEVLLDRGSIAQYARLFVSSDLPKDLSRVLYLDCDIIVVKSIKELWNMNLHGKTIAALNDAFSKYYRRNIDLEPTDVMFNSGVMLIDLVKWRKSEVEKRILTFIEKKNGKIQQGDQGALNHVLSRETFCFEPRFNSVTIFYDFSYEELMIYRRPVKGFYTSSEILKAKNDPTIIHFTTSFLSKRPWVAGSNHMYRQQWEDYKAISPWNKEPLRADNISGFRKIELRIFSRLPRSLSIRIAGLLQAYARPLFNKFRI